MLAQDRPLHSAAQWGDYCPEPAQQVYLMTVSAACLRLNVTRFSEAGSLCYLSLPVLMGNSCVPGTERDTWEQEGRACKTQGRHVGVLKYSREARL